MDQMLAAIERVTTLLGEIAAASHPQAHGIEQVTTAVPHMDEVTQQNAALVEQAAAASGSMNEQAVEMLDVVAGFRTIGAAGAIEAYVDGSFGQKPMAMHLVAES